MTKELLSTSKKLEFGKFEVYLLEPDLLYMHYYDEQIIDIKEIKQGFAAHDELGVNHKIRRIIHCGHFVSITKEARELVESEGRPAKLEAYVIPSLHQKILFNLYKKIRNKKHPLRAFGTLELALAWINR